MFAFLVKYLGYSVTSAVFAHTHYCWSRKEAIEWAKQYPNKDVVYIRRMDRLVSVRYGN